MSLSTPRQRTPGRPSNISKDGPKPKGPKVQPAPSLKSTAIPKYTQEELDADVCKPNFWLFLYERFVCLLAFTAMCVYLSWRWHAFVTLPSTYWISIPLVVSETLLVLPGLFITMFMIWHRIERPRKRLADMNMKPADLPTVDVYIPCLNEPVDVSTRGRTEATTLGLFGL